MSSSRWKVLLWVTLVASALVALGVVQAMAKSSAPNTEPSHSKFAENGSGSIQAAARGTTLLWAVVDSDGRLARDEGARDADRLEPGRYEVLFNQNVRNCAYVASIGLSTSEGTATPGQISTSGRKGDRNGVFVSTQDSKGAEASRSFHLAVFCPTQSNQ
jgi:hypothetical protein